LTEWQCPRCGRSGTFFTMAKLRRTTNTVLSICLDCRAEGTL